MEEADAILTANIIGWEDQGALCKDYFYNLALTALTNASPGNLQRYK